jgi:two-component system OmpR family response regulator
MTETTDSGRTAVIVEDDVELRHLLVDVLEAAGFSTVSVGNGIDGIQAVLSYQPLITTLDVNMPGIDGIEAARRIRAHSDTYIVMITAMGDEADVVLGLTAGADEYITKPFRPREFRARIDAMLRRGRPTDATGPASTTPVRTQESAGPSFPSARTPAAPTALPEATGDHLVVREAGVLAPPSEGQWLSHRNLRLDLDSRIVMIDDQEVDLTRTEFDLLAALLESRRRVRSKADLTLVLRGESYVTTYFVGDADKRAVEAHMTNLRRKIGDSPAQPRFIETVRGVGYRLTAETAPQA